MNPTVTINGFYLGKSPVTGSSTFPLDFDSDDRLCIPVDTAFQVVEIHQQRSCGGYLIKVAELTAKINNVRTTMFAELTHVDWAVFDGTIRMTALDYFLEQELDRELAEYLDSGLDEYYNCDC